jgi:hypothetical protein
MALGEIVCGEIGSADAERWSEPQQLAQEDRCAIEALESNDIVETRSGAGGIEIGGIDQVGTIVLPTGRRLHIRAKIGDLVVLDWLAYLGDGPPAPPRAAGESFALRGSLSALVAQQFLTELEMLTGRPLRAAFVEQRCDDSTVRGRILPHALARAFHRFPSIPQSRRARTLDTPHHQLLAAALDRLPSLLPVADSRLEQRLGALSTEWSVIDRRLTDIPRIVADCTSQCPPGYAPAVRLAPLILLGASVSRDASAARAGLLVSLAGVWERALRRMCRELAESTGWRPVPEAARTKRWDDGPGLRDPTRWMTADVILTSGPRRWVLDAKYKRGYGDEERNDRFQMTAYAMAFNARRATLVYPTAMAPRPRWRLLLAGEIAGQPTTIDSIELPMSAGPAVCRQALLEAMLSLGAAPVKPAPGPAILSAP